MAGRQKKLKTKGETRAVPVSPWPARFRSPAIISFLLALATLIVFLPVSANDFVNYDDPDYVTSNSHVQGGLSWSNVVWAFETGFASNWHPLTWLSHMLDYQLFGQHAGGHHLISVLFHIVNTVLLFQLLNRMTGGLWQSALVAALFALHPLHVESVAWVSERKDVLSALFFLLTLDAYARYVERTRSSEDHGRIWFYLLALTFFALGLLSKPMLVTLPFVLLLLDYWPLRRIPQLISGGQSDPSTAEVSTLISTLFRFLIEKVPFFALSVISSAVTFIVQRKGGAVSSLSTLSVSARVANALVSYVRYMGKMFWPFKLSVLYPHPGHWPAMSVLASAALLLGISAFVVFRWRSQPYLVVGWLWFLGILIPVIGLVQVGIQSMADRYSYVPLIGLLIMLVWGLNDASAQASWFTARAKAIGATVALVACAGLSLGQIHYWHDSETLFRRATQVTTRNYLAYNNLGFYLSGKGKVEEAMENYRRALEIEPFYEDAQNNLGYALAGQKKYAEAIQHYEAALRVRPNHVEVHNNLGNALADTGNTDEAIKHYLIVLKQKPDHADAHNNLGIALSMKGKFDEAISHFHEAIRFKPNYASAHSNLGNALAVQHKLDEAIKEYQESLRLKPDDAQAHNNLANALAEQGKLDEAISHYGEALSLNHDNPEAHFNLGIALLRQSKRDEAKGHFLEALKLKPDYAEARKQLEIMGK
jgi:tetratricopeptide (TPR) repeat protein